MSSKKKEALVEAYFKRTTSTLDRTEEVIVCGTGRDSEEAWGLFMKVKKEMGVDS